MPRKPLKPCRYQGCPNLTDSSYCKAHSMYERKSSGSRNPFYRSKEWREARKAFLEEHPICIKCGAKAEIVDHIVPIKRGGALLDESNFQPLCWSCHARKSVLEGSCLYMKVYSYENTR